MTQNETRLTTGEAAQLLGCRRHHLYYLLRHGKLPEPQREGDKRFWDLGDLVRLKEALNQKRGGLKP